MKIRLPARHLCLLGALTALPLGLSGCTQPSVTPPDAPQAIETTQISLTPRLPDGEKVETIDVELILPEPAAKEGDVLLSMAIIRVMMPSALHDPDTLLAHDDLGPLPLTIDEDAEDPSAFRQDRRWHATRATQGDVTVTYPLTPRVITAATRPGPLIDTRTELSGFVGAGNTMLALPPEGWPREVAIKWDLSEMPDGARAATSLGEGNTTETVTLQNISNTFFMAGPLKSQPKNGEGDFVIYWMTPASFDLQDAAAWTEKAYDYFVEAFDKEDSEFRIFMRTTERFQGGGGGGFHSFIFGTVAGEDRDPKEVRSLLAHETLHYFTGGYGEGGGAGGQQWYSEGSTSYFTVVMPYRAGLTSLEDFISDFNAHALNYYTNPKSNLSNKEVTDLFFSDHDAQLVPYNRGPLYFAGLDYQIRTATNGEKRVDDLILDFIQHQDEDVDGITYWKELLAETLGPPGVASFEDMMAGGPLTLPADLFGPCFVGVEQNLQTFKLGFRPYQTETGETEVGPVTPNTSAAQAGLMRHDIILNPKILDEVSNLAPGSEMTLQIQRNSNILSISYSPWTAPALGKQWERTDVPQSECEL